MVRDRQNILFEPFAQHGMDSILPTETKSGFALASIIVAIFMSSANTHALELTTVDIVKGELCYCLTCRSH